jgi:hypothetical protein
VQCREVKIHKGLFGVSGNKGPYPDGVSGNIVEWGAPSDFPGARVIPVDFEGPLKNITYGMTLAGRHAYRLFFENDRVAEIVVGGGGGGRRRRGRSDDPA